MTDQTPDCELLARFTAAGDQDAFLQLFTRHRELIWGVCCRLLGRSDRAEDALQITFLTLLKHADRIHSADFGPWLYRVAYRASLKVQNERNSRETIREPHPEPVSRQSVLNEIEQTEIQRVVEEELDRLPEQYRSVLITHYLAGCSRSDTAKRFETTVPAVKARLERGRRLLRTRLMKRGIGLSAFAAMLTAVPRFSVAAIEMRLLPTITSWQSGVPVNLYMEDVSDSLEREFAMNLLQQSTQKWLLLASVALLAVLVFRSTNPVGAMGRDGIAQGDGASRDRDFELNQNDRKREVVPAIPLQIARNQEAVKEPLSNSGVKGDSRASDRLPNGVWIKDNMLATIEIQLKDHRLVIKAEGKGELAAMKPVIHAEYSLSSDGMMYGIIHSIDFGMALSETPDLSELLGLQQVLVDMPFSLRILAEQDIFIIKRLNLGMAAADDFNQMGNVLLGTYSTKNVQ